MQPQAEAPEPKPYGETLAADDAIANVLSMVSLDNARNMSATDLCEVSDLLNLEVGELQDICTSDLDLSHLEYDYDAEAEYPLTIDTPEGYTIHCPEVITSAIQGYEFQDNTTDPTQLWNRAKVSAKSTSLSRPGNSWSWSYAAFLKLIIANAEVDIEAGEDALIRVCRICGRTACPYHGQPDGWVYIKVTA